MTGLEAAVEKMGVASPPQTCFFLSNKRGMCVKRVIHFYKKCFKDVSFRESDYFRANSLLIFASWVVGTCNILYG